MNKQVTLIAAAKLLALTLMTCLIGNAQVSVLTQHNDNARTGQNLSETALNTGNVNQSEFGKLFWRTVDGFIYAQPLYVPGLTIQGITRNVVYVATQHNSVYAFDADDPTASTPLWQVNLGTSVPMEDICIITGDTSPGDCPYFDISPEIERLNFQYVLRIRHFALTRPRKHSSQIAFDNRAKPCVPPASRKTRREYQATP